MLLPVKTSQEIFDSLTRRNFHFSSDNLRVDPRIEQIRVLRSPVCHALDSPDHFEGEQHAFTRVASSMGDYGSIRIPVRERDSAG